MVPGDLGVVLGIEVVGRHIRLDAVMHVANQAAIIGESDRCREKTLGDAEGHVDPLRLTPFRNNISVTDDDSGHIAAFLVGADGVAVRLKPPGEVVVFLVVSGGRVFVGFGEFDGCVEQGWVHAGLFGFAMFPFVIWTGIVDRVLGRGLLGCCEKPHHHDEGE